MKIYIISQGTEEEGTLSILHYLSLIKAEVNLIIESKLHKRISSNTSKYDNITYTIFSDNNFLNLFKKKLLVLEDQIILIPRIDFKNNNEFSFYKELLKNNFCYVGLLDHDRWLSSLQDFLVSQFKRPSIALLKDQKYCRKINKHIYGYLLFELDRNPDTIITQDILKRKKNSFHSLLKGPFKTLI